MFHKQPFTDPELQAYSIGLEGVKAEHLRLATAYLLKKQLQYMPTPAEIREAVQIALEQQPKDATPDCQTCGGTGYKTIPHPDALEGSGYNVAVLCDCRQR